MKNKFYPELPHNNLPILPPTFNFDDVEILKKVNTANIALTRLSGEAKSIPNRHLLIEPLSFREAVASSEIENIHTTFNEAIQVTYLEESELKIEQKETKNYREALLKGFETGSNHMARLLHNKMQQAQMQQAQNQFMQNFGLQQAQENRLQQLFPAQMQSTLAQAQMHQAQAGQLAQEQQMLQMMMGGMNGGSVPQFNSGQNFTSNQPPVQNSLPMNQGQDIYKPNNQAQPLGQVNPIQGPNVSPNALQNKPKANKFHAC